MDKFKKMQLGRRKAYLEKCIKVNELLTKYGTETSVRKRVFEKHIKPVIFCSYAQFYNILNEPNPYKQLEEINNRIASGKQTDKEDLGGANIYIHPAPKKSNPDNWDYNIDLPIE